MTPQQQSPSWRASPNDAPKARVAMVTSTTHRCGKQLVHDLAVEGFDVGVCSVAPLGSRVRSVEALGRRACATRLVTNHAASAALALDEVHHTLGRVYALIHLDAEAIMNPDGSLDATTRTVMPDLIDSAGVVVFLRDSRCEVAPSVAPGVGVIVLCTAGKFAPDKICATTIDLLRRGVGGVYIQSNSASPERVA